MIHDLTIVLNEKTLPFPYGGDPHMIWTHRADHNWFKCQVSLAVITTHLGTHVDAPLHFIKGGKTTAEVDLAAYCGQAVCLEAPGYPHEGVYDITNVLAQNKALIKPGDILILYTGFEKLVGTPEYFKFADFHTNTGALLESYGVRGIGFDVPSLDLSGEVHRDVLGRGIGVIESLINLEPLVGKRFYFSAVPLKFEDGDGSPVRAYAVTDD
ncbi:MAG: cyclase family protein [Synergistaceae bacterium]|jgi:kynurenine formamidase|nr:cyclase family protein [Synergistaceae bacterium]